ncbi:MAG: RidA family protein [Rhodoblastus sp.]|nr:MAG: RidA family protein [Rhodoblastus sp.]
MDIKRIGVGPRMSKAVVANGMVFLAGQVADKAAGGSVAEQTKEILATIDELLAQAGSNKTRLLSVNIWLSDMSAFAEMNSVWDGWAPQGNTPARATVEAKLAGPQYAVEIMATALV